MAFSPDSILLTDRVAVITGAAGGVGRATADLFSRFGARLAVCDREEAITSVDAEVSSVLDVRDAAAVDAFVADVERTMGRVDVLVNNAGGTFFAPFVDVNAKGEAALVAENFGQVTNLIRRTVPLMSGGGSIVNLTSVEAHQAAPGFAVYAAMKAALASLTRTLALELGPQGIRVNAVAPDAVPTEGDDALKESATDTQMTYRPAVDPPLGHLGEAEDVAAAVLYLASDLSRFVTGTTIHVDGGTWAAGGWHRTDLSE